MGWALNTRLTHHIPQATVHLLANGFAAARPEQDEPEIIVGLSAPGLLIGCSRLPTPPTLFSPETETKQTADTQSLHLNGEHVVLAHHVREGWIHFALAYGFPDHPAAMQKARTALDLDAAKWWQAEGLLRTPFWRQMSMGASPKPLLHVALETLIGHLRPAEGALSHRWMESALPEPNVLSLNDLWPYVAAWTLVDPAVAADLVQCALGTLRKDGFAPSWTAPDGRSATDTFAWPLLAQCVRLVADNEPPPDFLSHAMPRLRKYLERALARFEEDESMTWRTPAEAFIADTFDLRLATVDLSAFLLSDLEAYLDLHQYPGAMGGAEIAMSAASSRLAASLSSQLWDAEAGCFRDRYIGGKRITRSTLSSFLPLLWSGLDSARCQALLKNLSSWKEWQRGEGMPLWQAWPNDPTPPPIRLSHQFFLLQALRAGEEDREAESFAGHLRTRIARYFRTHGEIPSDLRSPDVPPSGSVEAAVLIDLERETTRMERTVERQSPWLQWMDRHRVGLIGGSCAFLTIALLSIILVYLFKRVPTIADSETRAGFAQRLYQDGRYDEAIRLYRELAVDMGESSLIQHRLANALYRKNELEEAAALYEEIVEKEDNSPVRPLALYNLAITSYQLNKISEARSRFNEVIERYGEAYPRLREQAESALALMDDTSHPQNMYESTP